MGTVNVEQDLPVPADKVWKVLADFAGFLEWTGTDPARTIEITGGPGVGMTRHLTLPGIGTMAERLDTLDHGTRTQVYTLVAGKPIGMGQYRATVVVSDRPGGCRLNWTGVFEAAPGADEAEVAKLLEGSYTGMSQALAAAAVL
ncbi:SRPBCC family protein [Emcibacter sp. SYSU 3D8]|uniref:SRPBCC family protein n=1 Tax=Emcibacter sp. SYSU 3D8 TaxID=3133969 RepID=UPI0031FF433F